jgi:hypothetical protein
VRIPSKCFAGAAVISVVLFALAFVAAPKSCEGGLEFYFWSGVVALVALFALPFVTRPGDSVVIRFAWAFGFLLSGIAVWFAGLFAANVRILCRLF